MSVHSVSENPSHTTMTKILHWVMAILILLMFMAFFGFAAANTDAKRMEMLVGHSSIGTIVLVLAIIRLINAVFKSVPNPSHNLQTWQKNISAITHKILYVLLFYVPLTGLLTARVHDLPVMLFGSINLADSTSPFILEQFVSMKSLHLAGVYCLMVILTSHILAALFHKFVLKDAVLSSMWRKPKSS